MRSEVIVGTAKSAASIRDVAIPPYLVQTHVEHLDDEVEQRPDALLLPAADGRNMSPTSPYWHDFPASKPAGRPDLRFHDLRQTGHVSAASTGATLAELMARLGRSTPAAAMKYQHAATNPDPSHR